MLLLSDLIPSLLNAHPNLQHGKSTQPNPTHPSTIPNDLTLPSQSSPIFYLIRHGEKPPKINGQDQDGLDAQGLQRAQRLVSFFGTDSPYNIGLILAEKMKDGEFSFKLPGSFN